MYEARIIYNEENRSIIRIEADTVEELKIKCQPWITGPNTKAIQVVEVKEICWFK